ncbi:MAG: Fic family protein [Schwartzia sp.]|nr:Fic family protein [Schwartzia sp. (in: firmicutes)]
MPQERLLALFHQDEDKWKKQYDALYNSPLSRHIDIPIQQFSSKRAFPAFFYYTEPLASVLADMTAEIRNLLDITKAIPPIAVSQFQRACLVEEIQSSNDIEGVRSTRKEIHTAIDEQANASGATKIRLWSIVNKYKKLEGKEKISLRSSEELRQFYDSFILGEVVRDNPRNRPDGEIFRKASVDVWSKTKIIHRGVYPEEKIIAYMDKALELLNDETVPGLVRVAAFHYLFGYIHPFYDGNGRTSRFISSYYLAKMLHPLAAIRLSITIKKSLRTYYRLFEETNAYGNCGDLTPFISGFLSLILKSVSRVNSILQAKHKKMLALEERLRAYPFGDKADYPIYFILLQAALFSEDGATLEEIASTLQKSSRTIDNRIKKYPAEHLAINKSDRAYRYKLRLDFLRES